MEPTAFILTAPVAVEIDVSNLLIYFCPRDTRLVSLGQIPNILLVVSDQPGQVILPVMAKIYRIELESNDLGQLLDGLNVRAEAWEKTAAYHRTGEVPGDDLFLVEECTDEYEANAIAEHYRTIIQTIREQREAQA